MDIDKLKMDAAIAELMEWKGYHELNYVDGDTWYSSCKNCGDVAPENEDILAWNWGDPPIAGCEGYPRYSTDIAAAYQVEERIEELGLWRKYCWELIKIVSAKASDEMLQTWYLIHATPEDRCRAALKAVETE